MITYSIIQKSQLEGALRLDAEYYQPEYLEVKKILSKYKPLKNYVGSIIHPQEVKREYSTSGFLFILSQNIKDNYLDFSTPFYIDKATAERISKNLLHKGDILTIRTGEIGKTAVFWDFEEKVYASADVLVIKNSKISPLYISTFLNSKFGQLYLKRIIYGALQPHITPKLLGEIPLPIIDKQEIENIHKLVENALQNFKLSENLYSQAENLLLEELGLKDFKVEDDLSYVVNLSDVKSAHRADAEYFQPKYEKLISKIRETNFKKLGDLVILIGHSTQPEYVENGNIAVLAQKHMQSRLSVDTDNFDNFTDDAHIKASDKKFVLRHGDVLISSAGEPGLTCVWNEEHKNRVIPGSFVTVIRTKEIIEPFYLGVFLNTFAGKLQFEKFSVASVQHYVYPKQIKELIIPILPKPIQQKIADLVQKSHQARKKAKQLLAEAKNKVENLIEKSL